MSRSARANSSSVTRTSPTVASSNSAHEREQDLVALDEDALEDLPDGLGGGGVDLELRGFEPPAPLAQVEDVQHQESPSLR